MLDVYKKIKNNDIDFLLEDDDAEIAWQNEQVEDLLSQPDGPDPDTDPNAETDDAFAADYDEDDEDDDE